MLAYVAYATYAVYTGVSWTCQQVLYMKHVLPHVWQMLYMLAYVAYAPYTALA